MSILTHNTIKMGIVLIPKNLSRSLSLEQLNAIFPSLYYGTSPKDPYVGRAYTLNKPILSELEEKTKHFHNMQKPAHEREILVTMSEKEIAEVFSARLIAYLRNHFENYKPKE